MTSGPEMHAYAQEQGDGWGDLPANGEGWDKPSSVDGEDGDAHMKPDDTSYGWKKTQERIVTCSKCAAVIESCRGVKFKLKASTP